MISAAAWNTNPDTNGCLSQPCLPDDNDSLFKATQYQHYQSPEDLFFHKEVLSNNDASSVNYDI